ncbi:MAG: YesL family protein [Lachnospiraceae bacterium]
MKFFSVDSSLYRAMCKLTDLLKLNFLWILFSLPIVTVGASTVAAMSVALKMADNEEGYIFKDFLKAFRENWKQGTALWAITVVACYAVYLDFQLFEAVEGNPIIFLVIGILGIILTVVTLIYAYPLVARYENTLFGTLQNSIEISKRYFGKTLLIVFAVWVENMIFRLHTTLMFLGFLFGPAVMIFTVAIYSKRIFKEIEKEPGAVIS